jgi:hypothetical protein
MAHELPPRRDLIETPRLLLVHPHATRDDPSERSASVHGAGVGARPHRIATNDHTNILTYQTNTSSRSPAAVIGLANKTRWPIGWNDWLDRAIWAGCFPVKTILILFFCSVPCSHPGETDLGHWCNHVGSSTFIHVTPSASVLVVAASERSVSEADLADEGEPRLCPDHPGLPLIDAAEPLPRPRPLPRLSWPPDRSPILRC